MKNKRIYPFFLAFLFLASFTQGQLVGQVQVCSVIAWIQGILLLIIISMVIFSGYQIMTSGGDTGRLEQAKTRLLFSLVGGAVIYAAPQLVSFFFGIRC
jgi:NADH:ubiquinone oxidoreductase subunit 2 (subunit N)